MSAHVNAHKLIPIKNFEDLVAAAKIGDNVNHIHETVDGSTSGDPTASVNSGHKSGSASSSGRSINSIQEQNASDITTLPRPPPPPTESVDLKTGFGGHGSDNNLMWIHNDAHKLPQFSVQSKIADSYRAYNDILKSKVPDDLKIKLMQFYGDRYNNTRKAPYGGIFAGHDSDDSESGDTITTVAPTQQRRQQGDALTAVSEVIKKTSSKAMKVSVKNLANELIKHDIFFQWDVNGNITFPKSVNTNIINLHKLIRILIYVRSGTMPEHYEISNIIRPFYKKIKPFVRNKSILSKIEEWDRYKGSSASTRHYQSF